MATDDIQQNEQKKAHFIGLLRDFKYGMLTTRSPEGDLHGRPMSAAKIEDNGELVFITDVQSEKVGELGEDPQVNVTLQDGQKFVSVGGTAEVQRNTALVETLWNEAWKVWFPNGPQDPNLVIIRVMPRIGEYWDNSGVSGVRYLYRAVKAYAQGTRPRADQDNQGKVQLRD